MLFPVLLFLDYKSREAPKSLAEIPEYFAIKIGLTEELRKISAYKSQRVCKSYISIYYLSPILKQKAKTKRGQVQPQHVAYQEFDNDNLNFAEEDTHFIKYFPPLTTESNTTKTSSG